MSTQINAILRPTSTQPLRVQELTERQIGIVLAAMRHAQEDASEIDWEEWIETFPNPQDDELEELCELLNSSVFVEIAEQESSP